MYKVAICKSYSQRIIMSCICILQNVILVFIYVFYLPVGI